MTTPAQHIIRSKNDEITRGWNRARFRRLAQALKLTDQELGELAYAQSVNLSRYLKENRFPPPIAGHLHNIEAWAKNHLFGVPFQGDRTAQDIILQGKARSEEL